MSNSKEAKDDGQTIDIRELIGHIINRRWFALIITFIFIVCGAIYCVFRTHEYKTNLLLNASISATHSNLSGLFSGAGGGGFSSGLASMGKSQMEMNILESRSVLEPVITKLHLDIIAQPKTYPLIGKRIQRRYNASNFSHQPAKPWFNFSSYGWGGNSISIAKLNVSNSLKGKPFILIANSKTSFTLYNQHGKKIGRGTVGQLMHFKPSPHSDIWLNISNLTANPGTHFIIEKMIMGDAIKNIISNLFISQVGKFTSLLKLTFKGENPVKIAMILNAIASSAVAYDVQSQSHQAKQTLTFLKSRVPNVQKELVQAEKALNDYRSKTGNLSLTAETKLLLLKLGQIQTEIETVKINLNQIRTQYTAKSFQVRQTRSALKDLEAQKATVQRRIRNLPNSDQIQVGLARKVAVKNAIFTTLQNKIQQFEIMEAGTVAKVGIIDSAPVPYLAINKHASIVLVISAVLGFLFSVFLIFIQRAIFPSIDSAEAIEEKLGLTALGSLQESKPHAKQLKRYEKQLIPHLEFLAEIDPHDLVVEALRSIRTNIMFEIHNAKNNIIAISGPTPNVGKSFVSANFAQVLADAGQKILLIDCDIRKGDVYQYFKADRTPGFCDLLSGTNTVEEVIVHSRMKNLDFIPTGTLPEKHSELLMQENVQTYLEAFSKDYDFVLVDTAPILAVTDALQIFKHAGTKIVTFAYDKHSMKELEHTIQRFEKAGISLNGFIFNRINTKHIQQGYKYNYKYGAE